MKGLTVYDDALNLGLPKWPAFVVVGDDVTPRQAAEILIRTDGYLPDFEYASNSRELNRSLSEVFGVPIHDNLHVDYPNVDDRFDLMVPHWAAVDRLRKRLGILSLEYLSNCQIVSSFIGGPHGWVDWAGRVYSNSTNIGKWPSVETVAKEWVTIAKAFPFLNLRCQLYDKESCEDGRMPVVTFEVSKGQVVVRKADSQFAVSISPDIETQVFQCVTMSSFARESGIKVHLLREKVIEVYGRVPMYRISKKDVEERKAFREKKRQEEARQQSLEIVK